jgi:hypothetical protein
VSDHDSFETFKATMSTDLHPLPAAEVRRRGDRLRRRNTALAVAGGTVAAMTAIGVPIALTQTGGSSDGDAGLVATQGPSADAVEWRTDVPEGFPVTGGFPGPEAGGRTTTGPYQAQAVGPCAGPAWDVSGALDSLAAVYQDPSEGGLDRVVAVFADDEEASARLAELARQVETCEPQGQPPVSAEPLPSDLGEESVVFVNGYDETGEGFLHQAVRVGNAVLYSTAYFNGAGDSAVVEQTRELEQDRSAEVVTAMCVFAADPC